MANFSAFSGLRDTKFDVPKDIQEPKGTFAEVAKNVLSQKDPSKVSVKQVVSEIPGTLKKAPSFVAETFAPAITEFFKTTGGILGEGLAYAVDENIRTQFQAGNLDILPTVSSTTQLDLAKKTIGAGIETAVYRNIPVAIRGNLATRGGVGALQGLGFAVAEGLATDKTAEEIIDSAKVLGPAGAVINIIAPYLMPILKAEMRAVPTVVKKSLQGLKFEAKGVPLKTVEANTRALRQVDELFPLGAKKAKTKIVAETPELQKFVDKKSAILRKTEEVAVREIDEIEAPIRAVDEVKPVIVPKVSKELEPLAKEVKKFKTADEFVEKNVFTTKNNAELRAVVDETIHGKEVSNKTFVKDRVKISELKPTEPFGTEAKSQAVDRLVRSLRQTKQKKPIVINKSNEIINGNTRAEALTKLGVEEIDVLKPSNLTKSQLTDFFNKVKGGEAPIPKAEKAPTPTLKVEIEEGVSKHFERIKADLGAVNDSVTFEKINLKDQAKQAFLFAEKSPEEALQVAYGLKNAPGTLTTGSVQVSMIESLKSAGKFDMARAIARRMSLNFTKSAQELNIAKLDLGSAGARKIESLIMDTRLKKIGKNIPSTVKDITPRKRALNKIAKDSKVASKEIQKSTRSIYKTADDLLDALTC